MIAAATPDAIDRAAALIRQGQCVAFPTETVYGLGADATSASAAARIFSIKERPRFDPLIVHVADPGDADDLVEDIPAAASILIREYWPGPLTLVLRKRPLVPDIVTAGLPSVAIRVPDHPVAQALIRRSERPIAAPSANPFGYVSPTTARHVARQLGDRIPMILDGGPCKLGLESTILSFASERPTLLRHGAISREAIERRVGPVAEAASGGPVQAPGQIARHYSPAVPVSIVNDTAEIPVARRGRAALLAMAAVADQAGFAKVEVLSTSGDLEEAAPKLFSTMRALDESDVDHIFALAVPESGIGRAIMDRLRRAANR